MFTRVSTTIALALFLGMQAQASFADDAADLKRLKDLTNMGSGNRNEGKKDNRNHLGTGSVKDWLTYPSDLYVNPHSESELWSGRIIYHFTGRERVADYVAGAQRDTNDYQTSGKVTADYEIGRRGTIYITNVQKHGGRGRVGDAVVKHIRSLNGQSVR